jgi:hypothetical protein
MLRILHLSDLHYGWLSDGTSSHRFVNANGQPDPDRLAGIITRDVTEPPHVVVVSGDVGWSCATEDYALALRFFDLVRDRWKSTSIVIAPGNHDVNRTAPLGTRQEAFVQFLRNVHKGDFKSQYPLFQHPTDRSKLVSFLRINPSKEDDLLIVAVNSAAYLEDKGEPVGFTAADLEAIDAHLATMNIGEGTLRLFVLHHALFPFAEPPWQNTIDPSALNEKPDLSIVANSATLQGWLADRGFQIVLHGHKHAMHGRLDTLWRQSDPQEGSQIFVIGAGSTGVEYGHLAHTEPLSFNTIHLTRLASTRWGVDLNVWHVPDPPAKPRVAYSYAAEVGAPPSSAPLVFHAETMVDCHRAIQKVCKGRTPREKILRNFISIVESCDYELPSTAQFHGKPATSEQIDSTFEALHPEHKRTEEWKELDKLETALREASPRFQFQHGPRLFGIPHGATKNPIVAALDRVQKDRSDGYVSLFRPEIDTDPLPWKLVPHLMSIQFLLEEDFLDIVVTFRKIELSYWWVANMHEVSKLLKWAAERRKTDGLKPRRITFFAALAEWKDNPQAAFVTRLDETSTEELTRLVADVSRSAPGKKEELISLLKEKRQHTNENNLDAAGLSRLNALFSGLSPLKLSGAPPEAFISKVADATTLIKEAMLRGEKKNSSQVDRARAAMAEAIRLLGGSSDET